ncbi:MAG TPA: glycosyltransferase family 2 protein [Rhizomicrobium sp.]|nr:glycosyltransferase family 2 protein [Rhizomicrobium sp.]
MAVAIVGFRNPDDIVRCLKALERSTHQDFEVVVCENGGQASFDALAAILPSTLEKGQKVSLIKSEKNGGYAGGVNICIKATPSADAWWVLNPDTEPMPASLERMVSRLGEGDVDAVGNTLLAENGSVQSHGGTWQRWLARAVSIGSGEGAGHGPSRRIIEKRQNYLNGASMLIGRRFRDRAGLMREDYFLYCEEIEWCIRAARHGLRLGFAEDAPVLHRKGTTTGFGRKTANPSGFRSDFSLYLSHRNAVLLTRDCFPYCLAVAAPSALFLTLLRCRRQYSWPQLRVAFMGWLAGLRGERGVPSWMSISS